MTILRPVRLAHILLPTTRRSTQLGTSARILPVLATSFALAVGADPAQASIPFSPPASDTLRVTLSAPEGSMVAEGATGHFEVSVAGSTADGAVTIRYSVSGTAVAGEDYAALSGVVTVAQGESTARIALEAFEDGILDKGETVVLALTGATGPGTVVVDQTAATATIADDGSVTVSLTAVPDTIGEGAAWSSTVTMSTPVADRVSVRWRTTDGTALAGRDYTAADEVLSFQPGETSKSISVQTLEDDNSEAVEVFYVSLDPPSISASAATIGALAVNGDARSVFIDCSIRFPPGVQTLFRLNDPVSAGTLVGTVTAEASAIADYFLTGGDNKFTINARGQIRTTAALDAGGFYELAVTAVDHCDAKASIDVTVIVNSSPQTVGTIPDGTVQVGGSGTVDVSPYFSDPDGNRLTYTASSSKPSVVSVNVSGSKVTYTGEAGGSASVTVTAKDPGGLSVNQSFTVSVNRPPKCKPIPAQEVREDKSVKVDLASLCTDPDGDNLAFEDPTTSDNRVATVGLDKNVLTINGVARGSATVGATVSDGNGGSTTTSGPVEVTRNEPPECNPIPSQTLDPGESVKVDLADLCIDPEKEGLRYGDEDSKDESVATVSLDGSELTITGVARGSTEVSATATDPHDESATAAGSATVPNSPPEQVGTIPGQSIDWGERGSVDVTSYFRDRDGDALKYTAVSSAPTIVSVGVSGSKVTYTGEAVGTATVTVTADDDNGGTAKQLFNVTVTNRSPTCDPIPRQTVDEGKSVAVDLAKLCSDEDPDDRLRYSDAKSTKPTVATVSLNGSVLTIEGVAGGDATVSAVATDLHNASATASGPVEVEEEVNRRPTARAGRDQRVDEGDLVKLDGSRSTDPDGTIERWLWTGPVKLTNPNSTKASFTAPEVDTTTAYTFTLQVWDDKDATDTDLMKVTVEPVDTTTCEAPRANAGRDRTVRELRRVTLDGSGSTGESSYAWKQVGGRTVTLSDADTATPWFDTPLVAADEVLTFRLTVTTDCDTTTDTDDVRVTIRDNRAPEPKGTIPAQPVRKGESGTVSVSGYFQDRDGDALTYTATSSATGVASVSVTGSTVKYTGKAVGSAQVTVTARDRYGATAKQEFRVTVTTPPPTNRAPVIESVIPARAVVAGDSVAVRVSPHFSDPDKDALTYTASSSARTVATVRASNDTVWVRGVSKGSADVTVTAADPRGLSVSQDFKVTVSQGNAAPEVLSAIAAMTLAAGDSMVVDVSGHFRDPDGDALIYEAQSSNESAATVKADGSEVTVRGVSPGELRVTVTARDTHGASVSQGFDVTVEEANEAPEVVKPIRAMTLAPKEHSLVDLAEHFYDPDGDDLGYGAVSLNESVATVRVREDRLTVTGVLRGASPVTVTAEDGRGGSVSLEFVATVPNRAPERLGTIPDRTIERGDTASVAVPGYFGDLEGDTLTYTAVSSDGDVVAVGMAGDRARFEGLRKGVAKVTVTADDGHGGRTDQEFVVTVEGANEPPRVAGAIPALTVARGGTVVVDASPHFRDPDGDTLRYEASSSNEAAATVKVSGSEVSVTGVSRGESRVTVTARDPEGASVSQAFLATVPNTPPVAVGSLDPLTLDHGTSALVEVSSAFSDPDGDSLAYRASSSDGDVVHVAVRGSRVGVNGLKRGEATVTVTVEDGHGGTVEQAFEVTVRNAAPRFGLPAYEREVAENSAAGTAVGDPVTAFDTGGDALNYSFAGTKPSAFEIAASSGQIAVAAGAALDYERGDTLHAVRVVASDGTLADTVGVTIRVTDVPLPGKPDAPVVTGGAEEVGVSWSAPANAGPEIASYDLRYRAQGDSDWTDVSALGAVLKHTITGLAAETTYSVQVRAESSEGVGEWSEPGEGTTEAANRAPSFDAEAYEREVPENSAAGTAVGDPITATDADDDDLEYSFLPGGAEVPFEIGATSGRITVAEGAALDHEGEPNSYALRVEASDGTLADTTAVTIRVTDVPAPGKPDAPAVTGGTEEVSATWSAPANEGPAITGYDYRYRAKADSDWSDPASLKVVLAHKITGLKAGTTYLVQVRARSSEGAGAWSDSGEGETARANTAPSFGADAYEREVPENSAAGTAVGDPVTATNADDDDLTYSFVTGSNLPFAVDAGTGQIAVASGAALDHEGEPNSYAVRVEASDGTLADTTAVTIRVTDVPAPGKPDAPAVTGGTEEVAVSWSVPANEGPAITGYDYRYRAKADSDWSDPASLKVVLAHKITGLKAGTTYLVQVRARSSEGAGAWSDSGEGETARANTAPSFGADAYEREVPENSAGGTAVGDPVTATDADDDDLAYSLLANGAEIPFAVDAGTGQIAVAAGAALDYESGKTAYTVSVEASDGTLADTTAVTIRVTDVPAPGKPGAPTVTGGTEEVAVSWSAPANEGPAITGYDYRYRAEADSDWPDPASLEVVLAHTIAGLKAGTKYLVQVRAVSSEGAGAWSDSGEGETARANTAPLFDAAAYEREVSENSAAGTAVGDPVTATDADEDDLTYSFLSGGAEIPFAIDAGTGRIEVAEGAALNYESADTLYVVSVEARDRELADTASVTIRVTNADDPGAVALNPETARVGVEITPSLTDEDGVRSAGRKRKWQRSRNGNSWSTVATGRMYNPVTSDAGKWLRVVFTYTDGHGPGKRAESAAVKVLAANRAPAFGKDAYDRSVPENSPGGTNAGRPVQAEDDDGDELGYSLLPGSEAPFEIDAATGRIKVAAEAALNYESPDTLYTVHVEASDGTLADTASVTIRVKNADDPGEVTLSPGVARVGVELTATLTDEDGVRDASRKRKWQRSADGNSWRDIATGGAYNPVTGDEGKWLRAVFTYRDGHGPGKRAVSAAVKVLAANAAPSFPAVYEREVPENSPGGTKVGAPVAATDPDGTSPSYSLVPGGDEDLFGIDSSTGQIAVAGGAVLDYESGDTLLAVRVEASDGELADTASVKIRVTNADDPGTIALSADVARVGVRLTATLTDQDRSIERGKMRTWQRSPDGAAWTMVVQGAQRRSYTPTATDRGKYLRAVFTYTDGHGPGKRAESPAVMVVGATTPVVSFGAESYTATAGGSADVAVLLSPAASSALAIEVVAGDSARTVTFQTGAGSRTLGIGTAGLSAGDTLAVRFGNLPDGVAVGVPAATRIVVAAVAGDRVSKSVAEDGSPTELEVEYALAEYAAVAGGPGTEIALRVSPAADRRVAVPLTASSAASPEPLLPDSVVFQPGDSLAAFMLEVPGGTGSGLLALGFGSLPEAVSAGAVFSATVDIADRDPGPLRDEAFDLGLAVFGRAVAEGARQAVGARIDAVMRPSVPGSGTRMPGSAAEWADRAAGTLASLTGAPLNASSGADMARRSGSVDLPTGREAVRRLLPSLSFATALGSQSPEGRPRLGLWAEGSAQSFRGDPGIDYDGGLRALIVGADARIGSSALLGVSLMRSDGDLDYGHRSAKGSLGHAMNSVHPYLFLQPSPRIGLWAMAGYGSGDVRDDDRHGDTGASLRMLSGGVKVPLARSGAFGLALNGDAFTVGMRTNDEGREGSASRARALLEASWTAGGLRLATQAGARYDGGDADTGGGAETGASVGYAAHGLDLDLRGRLALGSGRHREWGAALRLAFDPGTRGEGFRLAISPRHGHDRSGLHGFMDGGTFHAITPATGRDWRLEAEAGYGLRNSGTEGALDSYTRLSADGSNRSLSFGTRYGVSQTLRLGIEGSRTQLPGQYPNLGIRLAIDFTF